MGAILFRGTLDAHPDPRPSAGSYNYYILSGDSELYLQNSTTERQVTGYDAHLVDTANPHVTDIENLGSGTLAELNDAITDATLDDSGDSRTPTSHASTHVNGDSIQDATSGQKGLATSTQITKLDGIEALADVTDTTNVTSAGAEMVSRKNQASGYPGLSAGSKLTGSQQAYGSASDTACVGNDSRLNDSRDPTNHASNHVDGDSIQNATSGQKGLATTAQITKLDGIETLADVTDTTNVTSAGAEMTSNKNQASGYPGLSAGSKLTGSQQTYGSASDTACVGNDSRLNDSRTPTQHDIDGGLHSGSLSWSKVNKTGSDLADLATKSHTDLTDKGTNTHTQIDTHIASELAISTVTTSTHDVGAGGVHNRSLHLINYSDTGECTVTILSTQIAIAGREIEIKDSGKNCSEFNISVITEGSQTIEGEPDALLNISGTSLSLVADGSNLHIV